MILELGSGDILYREVISASVVGQINSLVSLTHTQCDPIALIASLVSISHSLPPWIFHWFLKPQVSYWSLGISHTYKNGKKSFHLPAFNVITLTPLEV